MVESDAGWCRGCYRSCCAGDVARKCNAKTTPRNGMCQNTPPMLSYNRSRGKRLRLCDVDGLETHENAGRQEDSLDKSAQSSKEYRGNEI